MAECTRCAALEAQNQKLQAEVNRLKLHIRRLQAGIRAALHILGMLEAALTLVLGLTGAILSHTSGIPRGTWSFAKGANRIAKRAIEHVGQAIAELQAVL